MQAKGCQTREMFMRVCLTWSVLLIAASFWPAFAQSACVDIHDNAARLACYDSASGYARQPNVQPNVTSEPIVTPETNATPITTATATPIPEPIARAPQDVRKERDKISATSYPVSKIVAANSGKILVYFTDGQVWRQTDSKRVRIRKTQPSEATIVPGALGSFFVKWDGQSRFRAKRVR